MRFLAGTLATTVIVYALACLGLYLLQRSFIFYPQPRRSGLDASVMKLQVEGAQVEVSTRALAGPDAVVYFGGNAEDVSGSLPGLATAFPAHALYLMHYRGYGGSSGKPSQAFVFADALALFDRVHATHPNVVVVGRSLGSGVALHLASLRPATRLVLVTPYNSILELAKQQFPFFPVDFLLTDRFESWRYAARITIPTTVIAADHDMVVPGRSTRRLLGHFRPGQVRHVVIPNTGHNTISDDPAYIQAMR